MVVESTGVHWLEYVLTGVSTLNIALVVSLIKSSKERGDKTDLKITELRRDIAEDIEKSIKAFDKLCLERQDACSMHRIAQTNNVCNRLNDYAIINDRTWERLTREREASWERYDKNFEKLMEERRIAWEKYEKTMEEMWKVIQKLLLISHNHDNDTGKVIRPVKL